jgi:hypothetical protein
MNACAEGCYKHYVKGLGWVCCKCGGFRQPVPDLAPLPLRAVPDVFAGLAAGEGVA